MLSKPSIFASLATLPLSSLSPPRLLLSLVVLSLCGGVLTLPRLVPRALSRFWGSLPRYELQLQGGDSCLRCTVPTEPDPQLARQADELLNPPRTAPARLARERRAAAPSRLQVRLDAPLDIRLHPERPVSGPVFVHAFLVRQGNASGWPILMARAADGTLQLRGILRDVLDLTGGELGLSELVFVVQRSPLPLGDAAALAAASSEPDGLGTQLLHGALDVLAPANP
jgi:hypothetical protein